MNTAISARRTPLTELEIRHLLYVAKSRTEWETLHALLLFVGCGGISCSELFKLRRADVVLDRGKPRISITGHEARRSSKPVRTLYLSQSLAVAAYALLGRNEAMGSRLPEHFFVVRQTSKSSRPCDPARSAHIKLFRGQFEDVRLLANCPDATWRRLELSGRMGVVEC